MGVQRCTCGYIPPTVPGPLSAAAAGADELCRSDSACHACSDPGLAALEGKPPAMDASSWGWGLHVGAAEPPPPVPMPAARPYPPACLAEMPCVSAVDESSLSVCGSGSSSPREPPGQAAASAGEETGQQRRWAEEQRRRSLRQMHHMRSQLIAGEADPDSWREARSLPTSDDEEEHDEEPPLSDSADGMEAPLPASVCCS